MDRKEALDRWNRLAETYSLPAVRLMTPLRLTLLNKRMTDFPNFWEDLEEEIKLRGKWAREHRFPNVDHVCDLNFLVKILEGHYRGRPDSVEADDAIELERAALVRRILRHEGRMIKNGSEICRSSLVNARGYGVRWESLRMDQLTEIAKELER